MAVYRAGICDRGVLSYRIHGSVIRDLPTGASPGPRVVFGASMTSALPMVTNIAPVAPLNKKNVHDVSSSLKCGSQCIFLILP